MLPKLRSHQQYLDERSSSLHHNPIPIPAHHYWLLDTFNLLDLSPLRPIVESTYSDQGRTASTPSLPDPPGPPFTQLYSRLTSIIVIQSITPGCEVCVKWLLPWWDELIP